MWLFVFLFDTEYIQYRLLEGYCKTELKPHSTLPSCFRNALESVYLFVNLHVVYLHDSCTFWLGFP